ncbi:MAG: glycosyltransferase [bacterium]
MRICYIADASSILVRRWVGWFARAGHEVHLITDHPQPVEGVRVHDIVPITQRRLVRLLVQIYRVRSLLRRIRPEILHSHYITEDGWYGALSGFHPFVLTAWGSDVYRLIDIYRPVSKYAVCHADFLTANSEDLKKNLIALGANPKRVAVIKWGVDRARFHPGATSRVRDELGIGDAPVILSVRSLKSFYNIDVIIDAFSKVLRTVPEAKLIVLGSGPEERNLKAQAESLGIDDSIFFVGMQPYERMPEFLTAADVVVSVPQTDSAAESVGEALACGKPVIVSDLPASREWVKEGENGYIVPIRDPKSLAEKIVLALRNKNSFVIVESLGKGIEHDENMRKMERIYKGLVCKSS